MFLTFRFKVITVLLKAIFISIFLVLELWHIYEQINDVYRLCGSVGPFLVSSPIKGEAYALSVTKPPKGI